MCVYVDSYEFMSAYKCVCQCFHIIIEKKIEYAKRENRIGPDCRIEFNVTDLILDPLRHSSWNKNLLSITFYE